MKRGALAFCAIAVCLAQAPAPGTPPAAISAYYRLPNQAAGPYPYKWLVIDPPLTFRVDKDGTPHLGVSLAGVANCKVVDSGILCSSAVTAAGAVATMRGDVPVRTESGFQLAHLPLAGATCFRNGLRQLPPLDYQLTGAAITSTFWQPGVALACDYEYVVAP